MKAYKSTIRTLFLATMGASLLTACGDDEEKEAFLNKLEGTWKVGSKTGCTAKGDNGLLTSYKVEIDNAEEETYKYSLTEVYYIGDKTCDDNSKKALTVTGSGAFDLGDMVEGMENTFEVTETPSKFELEINKSDWVNPANKEWEGDTGFCGINDWDTGKPRDVTDKTCKIGTGFSQTYLPAAAGFDIMKIVDDTLTRGTEVASSADNRPTALADVSEKPQKIYYKEGATTTAAE